MILKGANMMNKLISYFGTFTPGADGAVGAFQFEYLTSLGFAALVIFFLCVGFGFSMKLLKHAGGKLCANMP